MLVSPDDVIGYLREDLTADDIGSLVLAAEEMAEGWVGWSIATAERIVRVDGGGESLIFKHLPVKAAPAPVIVDKFHNHTVTDTYYSLELDRGLATRAYDDASAILGRLEDEHGVQFRDPRNFAQFNGFVTSAAGAEWLREHESGPPEDGVQQTASQKRLWR